MPWVKGESGPQCTCGWPTVVCVLEDGVHLMCFGHTKAEGAMWPLPNDKPENWPNLSDEEMQALVEKGDAEHNHIETTP